jgi:AcrR family transcriptional regulator
MTSGTRPAGSRRERPAKPALTRPGIVAAALTVMRAEGLDRVTMRRIAAELDTGAASLYVYVRNTAELHAAMLEELLGQIDLSPVSAAGDWQDRLIEILTSYTAILFEHPGLAQSALVTRPNGPAYLGLVEAILALLEAGRISRDRASWGMDLLLHVATATAVEHGTRERAIDARDEEDAVAAALRDAPADRLDWGFRVLISGIIHTPRPEPETAP